jgi:hypothetical protein
MRPSYANVAGISPEKILFFLQHVFDEIFFLIAGIRKNFNDPPSGTGHFSIVSRMRRRRGELQVADLPAPFFAGK